MELVILNIRTLEVKDHALINEDFEIVVDSVIYQKSKFNVNKSIVNAEIGDVVFVKGLPFFYLGIISGISNEETSITNIEVNDFSALFDIQVPVKTFTGDLCEFLKSLIDKAFKSSGDTYQNLSHLNVRKACAVTGTLTYEGTELKTITEISEMLAKTYGIRYVYSLNIDHEGIIQGINVDITNVTKGMIIKSNLPCITDLVISDSNKQGANKITFYPKSENVTYKSNVSYYLYNDGTIGSYYGDNRRYKNVKVIGQLYSDNEYSSLYTKATSELLKSNLEHNIEFKIIMDNKLIVPFKNLCLGDFVEFVTPKKTYSTMVTQLSLKGNFYECSVVLGEYRIKLTDKIKLLEKK